MLMLGALVIAAAAGQPIYLRCTFPENGAVLDVTANEATAAVTTVLLSSNHIEHYPGAFSSTELRFHNHVLSYVIDRSDLTIRRSANMLPTSDMGTCRVQKIPKRAP